MDDKVKVWFNEVSRVHHSSDSSFVIFKGFKITKFDEGGYSIQNVMKSDMYPDATQKEISVFIEHGFVKGATLLQNERDKKRVIKYTKKLESLYTRRAKVKKESPSKKRDKKIRLINNSIKNNLDLVFFYKTRVNQFNIG